MIKKLFSLGLGLLCTSLMAQSALNFDGTDDYVYVNSTAPAGNDSRTIEAWIKTTDGVSSQKVILDFGSMTAGNRYTLNLLNGGKLRFEVGGNGFNGSTYINDGAWHHVALSYDNSLSSSSLKMYVDGVLEASHQSTVSINTTSGSMFIGSRNDTNNYFPGSIDEVRVWNVARTGTEILASMNQQFCTPPTGLVKYFTFNEGTGTVAIDAAGGSNGVITNFTMTGTISNWEAGKTLTPVGGSTVAGNLTTSACAPYTSPSGNYTWSTSGSYQDTIKTPAGCDSLLNINLTILPNSAGTLTATGCNSYTSPSGMHTWNTSGTYTDNLTAANGCDSVLTITLTINQVDTSVFVSGKTLTAWNSTGTYQWLDCNNNYAPIAGATQQTFAPTVDGSYALEISENSCTDTSMCYLIEGISVIENQLSSNVSIYPNPAKDIINVALDKNYNQVEVEIVSLTGVVVYNTKQSSASHVIIRKDLAQGLYLVNISVDGLKATKKLVVQ